MAECHPRKSNIKTKSACRAKHPEAVSGVPKACNWGAAAKLATEFVEKQVLTKAAVIFNKAVRGEIVGSPCKSSIAFITHI